MGSTGLGKYGNGRTHDPRCNCPDCSRDYAVHNAAAHCECEYCTQHREIYADAPRTTRPEEIAAQYERQRQAYADADRFNEADRRRAQNAVNLARLDSIARRKADRERKAREMGNLNICTRTGCSAIIKGDAAARVQVETSIGADGKETLYVLCPACVGDVDALLHLPPTSDRERAYETPYGGFKPPQADDVTSASTEQLAAELLTRLMADKTKALES